MTVTARPAGAPSTDPSEVAAEGLSGSDLDALLARHTEVLELIAGGAGLEQLLSAITLALEDLIAGSRCSVLLISHDGRTLHHGAAPSLPARWSAFVDGITVADGEGSCGSAAFLGRRVVAVDIATDPRWPAYRDAAMDLGLRSCWSSPILGQGGRVAGTFAVYHGEPHQPTGREQLLVDRFTNLASVAVAHAGLFGALAESEEKFRRAFEDSAVGMGLLDEEGTVLRANGSLARLVGWSAADVVGSPLVALIDPAHAGRWADAFAQLRSDVRGRVMPARDSRSLQLRLIGSGHGEDGAATVVLTVSALHGGGQLPVRFSLNVLDVTQRLAVRAERAARREAEVARATAEAHNRAKSELLTEVGHELRSPLQAITGFTELLGTLDLDAARRAEALERIDAAARHVLDLVDDVLDVARLEAHAISLDLVPVDVSQAVREVVDLLEPLAAQRRVRLEARPTDLCVCADPRRLRQILINLVTNGIKYSGPDRSVWVDGDEVGDGTVVIRVQDDGPGIPDGLQGRLFSRFDRLGRVDDEGGRLDEVGGSGLGLRVVRGLTQAMHGTVDLSSAVGRGTCVSLTLPGAARP